MIMKRLEQEVNHLCHLISKGELQKNELVRRKLIELRRALERVKYHVKNDRKAALLAEEEEEMNDDDQFTE